MPGGRTPVRVTLEPDGRQLLVTPLRIGGYDQRRVLPMELQIGDRLSDETGEWEVVGRLYTTGGGKNAHARLQRVEDPAAHEV